VLASLKTGDALRAGCRTVSGRYATDCWRGAGLT
jgi:hypothetical protein